MSIDKIFSGGVTCIQKSETAISGGFEDLILIILDQCSIESGDLKVIKSFEGEIFSEFIILIDGSTYSLKLTFDSENESFMNEVSFLKENKKNISLPYINSGLLDFSLKVKFLLARYENVFELKDFGSNLLMDETDLFLIAVSLLNNCKSEKSSEDYINMFFSNHDCYNSLLYDKCESSGFGIKYSEFCSVMDKIRKEIENSEKLESIKGQITCHGLMVSENLILKDGLFKFKNLNYNFLGNPLFDLAFLCVSFSLKNDNRLLLLKKYCDFFNFDFRELKKDYDDCIYIASCLFLYKNFFDLFVSLTVKNENFDTASSAHNISRSLKYFKKLPFYNEFKVLFEEITEESEE